MNRLHPARVASGLVRRVRETPPLYAFGTLGAAAVYLTLMALFTERGAKEQALLLVPFVLLAFWSDATRRFYAAMLPLFIFPLVYDLTHITEPLVRHLYVHVREPYAFDRTYFGIHTAEGVLTPNEFFRTRHWPAVDFVTGLAYIVFVYWSLGFAAYLALFRRDEAGRRLLRRFGWTFLFLNIAGYVTYYVYPAAPPWYVAQYGLGPANMDAVASPAAALRWDALTGIPYFEHFYGRSADVFGAIPSLHVAYPLLTLLHGRELRNRALDLATGTLFVVTSFAAVYLDHHYVLDVLIGWTYTAVAYAVDWALERRRRRAAAPAALPAGAEIETA